MSKIANQLMTVAAVGLAGFALYQFTKQPGGAIAAQPAQQQRDTALQQWFGTLAPEGWYQRGAMDYAALSTITAGQTNAAWGMGFDPTNYTAGLGFKF